MISNPRVQTYFCLLAKVWNFAIFPKDYLDMQLSSYLMKHLQVSMKNLLQNRQNPLVEWKFYEMYAIHYLSKWPLNGKLFAIAATSAAISLYFKTPNNVIFFYFETSKLAQLASIVRIVGNDAIITGSTSLKRLYIQTCLVENYFEEVFVTFLNSNTKA